MNAATINASRATSAYDRMRTAQTAVESGSGPRARVRTREVGFRLGGFGFTYTSRDLEMDPGADKTQAMAVIRPPARPAAARGHFVAAEPDTSRTARMRGLRAYADSLAEGRAAHEDAVPISTLLSVV